MSVTNSWEWIAEEVKDFHIGKDLWKSIWKYNYFYVKELYVKLAIENTKCMLGYFCVCVCVLIIFQCGQFLKYLLNFL